MEVVVKTEVIEEVDVMRVAVDIMRAEGMTREEVGMTGGEAGDATITMVGTGEDITKSGEGSLVEAEINLMSRTRKTSLLWVLSVHELPPVGLELVDAGEPVLAVI